MKKMLLALALAGSTLLSAAASAETLKIGTEGAYPPFNFQDSAGKLLARETVILVIAPEGTRRYQPHWKSGFLKIARAADMPVGLMAIDFRTRSVRIREYLWLSGDEELDIARIAAGFEGVVGHNPSQASPIRLR